MINWMKNLVHPLQKSDGMIEKSEKGYQNLNETTKKCGKVIRKEDSIESCEAADEEQPAGLMGARIDKENDADRTINGEVVQKFVENQTTGIEVKIFEPFDSNDNLPCSSSSNSMDSTKMNPLFLNAIVLTIDRQGHVCFFSPDKSGVPLFKVSVKGLDVPPTIGKWYRLSISCRAEHFKKGLTSEIPVFEHLEPAKAIIINKQLLRTRITDGMVQIYAEIRVDSRDNNGFIIGCSAENFLPILDTGGFLNGMVKELRQGIRHAPSENIGVWCSLRKYPMDGFWWKVVGVGGRRQKQSQKVVRTEKIVTKELKESNKSKATSNTPTNSEERNIEYNLNPSDSKRENTEERKKELQETKTEKSAERRTENKSVMEVKRNIVEASVEKKCAQKSLIRNAPDQKSQNVASLSGVMEGLICSQTDSHFVVYSSVSREMASLDKRHCRDNYLGMWIQYQMRINDGKKCIESFRVTTPLIYAIPTNEYVLLRCNVQIPRSLETSELPWCEELKINLSDPHQLLKHRHHGRNVEATIGTPAYLHNDGELQWQLLDVEEVQ